MKKKVAFKKQTTVYLSKGAKFMRKVFFSKENYKP